MAGLKAWTTDPPPPLPRPIQEPPNPFTIMDRLKRLLWKKENRDCQYCRGLQDGQVRIPAAALIYGAQMGCPACRLLYQSVSPADLADKRIALVHVRLFGDSQVCHTFDPGTEDMSRKLCAEEGKCVCFGR